MRVYVAGASKELDRAKAVIATLREAGYTITFDWVEEVERVGDANPADPGVRLMSAHKDVDGVQSADVFVLLHPGLENNSTGCWFELGLAIGMEAGPVVFISYKTAEELATPSRCIFVDFALHTSDTPDSAAVLDEDLVRALAEYDEWNRG